MKVLLLCGSPHNDGCTFTALNEVAEQLRKNGVESEFFFLGTEPIYGCTGCGSCGGKGRCVYDDIVNRFLERAEQCDGFIFGSPVYFAGANGALCALLDRAFYAGSRIFAYKPGAALCSARRAGTTATLDRLNKYFAISNMPQVPSLYWNMVHGNEAAETMQDLEGLQIMRRLADNMAWMLKSIEAGRAAGITIPQREKRQRTNFIR